MAAVTVTGYTFTRDDYTTTGLNSGSVAECIVGHETTLLSGTWFQAWSPLHDLAAWMTATTLSAYGGWWPNRIERGYRVVQLSFQYDSAGGTDDVIGTPLWSTYKVTRADVTDELDATDIYSSYADWRIPYGWLINYDHARDSMGILM